MNRKKTAKKKAVTPPREKRSYNRTKPPVKSNKGPERKVVSAAEATIKLAIWDGMMDSRGNRDEESSPKQLREKIFQSLFEPENRWAIEQHLRDLQ